MIFHLEPVILTCEFKWALEGITMNKANGGDGIPVELFQILKDDAVKVLHSISSVQFSHSVLSDSLRTHALQHARPPCPSPTPRSSLRLPSIKLVMPSSHLILGCPLLLLPPIPPSIKVFSNESTLRMRWPKYWSFSFSIHSFQRTLRTDLL